MKKTPISNHSEIGKLNTVIIHEPGPEMENMTPETAHEVLFDDIISLDLALVEHAQLSGVLKKVCGDVLEFSDLLTHVLNDERTKLNLLEAVCQLHDQPQLVDDLMSLDAKPLASQLFQGTLMVKNSLEKFLNPSRHAIPPLPNAFFTRDAVMCVYDKAIIGSMAHRVRLTEAILLKHIFDDHNKLDSHGFHFDGTRKDNNDVTIEGGDLLVIRDDLLIIGFSERTSANGIDRLAERLSKNKEKLDIIVVELPKIRATIHLDMIFTMLDVDTVMNFAPLITGPNKCRAFHMHCQQGQIIKIKEFSGLPKALLNFGFELNFVNCGGDDAFTQEREQWTSGANFFTFAPGHVIGYQHNKGTMEALNNAGFEIIDALDIINSKAHMPNGKAAVAMDGSELSRGGGGCRCMTLPVHRDAVNW